MNKVEIEVNIVPLTLSEKACLKEGRRQAFEEIEKEIDEYKKKEVDSLYISNLLEELKKKLLGGEDEKQ